MSKMNQGTKKGGWILPVLLIIAGILLFSYENVAGLFTKADLDIKIEHAPAILPAAYKVYANEKALDGKYHIFKMLITNQGKSTVRNIDISYDIPGYIDKTGIRKIPILNPGQSAVVTCFPSFNADIVEKTTGSNERVNIEVSGTGIDTIEESFPIEFKGRNEIMYTYIPWDEIRTPGEMYDNLELVSCFITPEDPIIKYYTQNIQEKVLKGETASVTNTEEEGLRFLTGIYEAGLASHMVYSGTAGVPSTAEGIASAVQSIRLPREVVTGNTGLCIELSILYASIMMSAGMDPIIYLVPEHAYPGFKMNGKYYAIEATGIGGEGLKNISSSQAALEQGMKQLEEFMKNAQAGNDAYIMLDVRESVKNGALAMELKDDPFLRKKVDEIAKKFEAQPANFNPNPNPGGNQQPVVTGAQGGGAAPSGYSNYNGAVSFAYPSGWKNTPKNPGGIPQNVVTKMNPQNEALVEVYEFPGIQNPEQAMLSIQQYVSSTGAALQYNVMGQEQGFTVFNGQTGGPYGVINWVAAFKPVSGGVAGIIIGVSGAAQRSYQTEMQNILNSLR